MKAACHVHSDWSYDGKWSLPDLATAFARRGYRVVMMTEHDLGFTEARRLENREACAKASSDEVLLVPGIEYSDARNTVHVLVWGPVPFLGEGVPTAELLKQVRAAGGVAVLAHPFRRKAWKAFDPAWADSLLGIEVWNRKTDGWAPSRTASQLIEGTALMEFVGLDFHDRNQFFPLAMEMEIALPPKEELVLECLKAKRLACTAFDSPLSMTNNGWRLGGLRLAETCRRNLASVYRLSRRKTPAPRPLNSLPPPPQSRG
jgi:hypothetical protein